MTPAERFAACLAVSGFVHFVATGLHATADPATFERAVSIVCDLAPPEAVVRFGDATFTGEADATDGKATEDEARKAMRRYLHDVSDAIHARRLTTPGTSGCLGTAWVSFAILPDGRFMQATLTTSSGNRVLDDAAVEAVRRASGTVARPRSTGSGTIALVLPVKFQLGL